MLLLKCGTYIARGGSAVLFFWRDKKLPTWIFGYRLMCPCITDGLGGYV